MSLKIQINDDIKTAMKEKDAPRRDALRLLASAIKQIEVDERIELDDDGVLKVIQKQLKQRTDAMEQYKNADRMDLYDKEEYEASVFSEYMPAQLSDDELMSAIRDIITKVGATSIKEIGKVMGMASKELSSVADGKRINECAKKLLG